MLFLSLAARIAALSLLTALMVPSAVNAESANSPLAPPYAPPPYAPPPYAPPAQSTVPQPTIAAPPTAAEPRSQAGKSKVKVGDLVRLPSGGPLMSVRAIEGEDAICDWQIWGELRSARFPMARLTVIGGPGRELPPLTEPQPYRPCPASVTTSYGRNLCLG